MLRYCVIAFFLAATLPATAETTALPKSIDLNQHFVDPMTQKTVPNDTERVAGIKILEPIHDGALNYAKGAVITDSSKVQGVLAWMEQNHKQYAAVPLDPDCAKCAPLTLGWVLEQAAISQPCHVSPGQTKPKECTEAETKAEDDSLAMFGRMNFAKKIMDDTKSGTALILTDTQRDTLKLLVKLRFVNAPVVAAEALMMIDSDAHPVEFGK